MFDDLDITYASLAKAFGQELKYHEETQRRMEGMMTHPSNVVRNRQTEAQKTALLRMTLFPADSEVFFVAEDLWVVRMIRLPPVVAMVCSETVEPNEKNAIGGGRIHIASCTIERETLYSPWCS